MGPVSRSRRAISRSLELWRALPSEAQGIYAELDPNKNRPHDRVSPRRAHENRIAVEVLSALCGTDEDLDPAQLINKHSPHLRGSSLERTLHPHIVEVRENPVLSKAMNSAVTNLVDTGVSNLNKYVMSRRPSSLDNFRAGMILLRTAVLFNPEVVRDVKYDLNKRLARHGRQYPIIPMFLPSLAGWGCDPETISDGDLSYLDFWLSSVDSDMWSYRASHVLGYYAPPSQGRYLVEIDPTRARALMLRNADRIRTSLIDEVSRKVGEGYFNAAWVGATYLKAHAAINFLDRGWSELSLSQARKFQNFIVFARYKTRSLDSAERQRLHGNMNSVEYRLITRYGLNAKVYRD